MHYLYNKDIVYQCVVISRAAEVLAYLISAFVNVYKHCLHGDLKKISSFYEYRDIDWDMILLINS